MTKEEPPRFDLAAQIATLGADSLLVAPKGGEGGTRRERVAAFLKARGTEGATNGEISAATGIKPRELVYNITQRMLARGDVHGRRMRDSGKWHFTWRT